jgi:hypothetical protein
MESSQILEQARAGSEAPQGWIVLTLERSKVLLGICGWIGGAVLGLGLFIILALITVPYNFTHGVGPAIFSSLLLAVVLFIGVGSIWSLIVDVRRLLNLEKHIIIINPDVFVKQEGDKVIQVPLMNVRNITARGASPAVTTSDDGRDVDLRSHAGDNLVGFFAGRGFTSSGGRWRRRRMRAPTSLAFVDARTEKEVTVVTDAAYGDPFMIAALLKEYARGAQDIV